MNNIDFALIDQITKKLNDMITLENDQQACNLMVERLILLESMIPSQFASEDEKTKWRDYLKKMHQDNELLLGKIKSDRDILKRSLSNYDHLQRYIDESVN